ncbi:hypothetical protein EHS19_09975 [Bifidobacterium jacchi]|uniref:Uncharacterized protein n=1 Tax=Bifidobacterium jacchi TaxID=2490545 RepID=A0A5N5RDW7_9BIFI|nr:hypothetical protein EHS19_09975 [Bifidobacterium jacchi]
MITPIDDQSTIKPKPCGKADDLAMQATVLSVVHQANVAAWRSTLRHARIRIVREMHPARCRRVLNAPRRFGVSRRVSGRNACFRERAIPMIPTDYKGL